MTDAQIVAALRAIDARNALPADVEYELEDLGLIVTDDAPYARLTDDGRAFMATRYIVEFNCDSDWTDVPADDTGAHSFASESDAIAYAVAYYRTRRDSGMDHDTTDADYDPSRDGIGVWVHAGERGAYDAPVGYVNPYTGEFFRADSDADACPKPD